jgi:hypothetical protein
MFVTEPEAEQPRRVANNYGEWCDIVRHDGSCPNGGTRADVDAFENGDMTSDPNIMVNSDRYASHIPSETTRKQALARVHCQVVDRVIIGSDRYVRTDLAVPPNGDWSCHGSEGPDRRSQANRNLTSVGPKTTYSIKTLEVGVVQPGRSLSN